MPTRLDQSGKATSNSMLTLSRRDLLLLLIASLISAQDGPGEAATEEPFEEVSQVVFGPPRDSKRVSIRYGDSLRPPTGIVTTQRPNALFTALGEYASGERAITTAADLIVCGPTAYTFTLAGMPEGWGEVLGVFVLAKCVPDIMADALTPDRVNALIHSGMDLLTPPGLFFGVGAGLLFGGDYILPAATIGSMTSDLRELIEASTNLTKVDSQSLIEGFDWLNKQAELMQQMDDRLDEESQPQEAPRPDSSDKADDDGRGDIPADKPGDRTEDDEDEVNL